MRSAAALLAVGVLCACTASTLTAAHSPSPSPSASASAAASEASGTCAAEVPSPAATAPSPPSPPTPPFTAPNLVQNGGAESDTGATDSAPIVPPSAWTATAGEPDVVQYGASGGFPTAGDPGPTDRGSNFFGGGNAPCSEMTPKIDLRSRAADIDGGKVSFYLSAWLGGWDGQDDFATVTVTFAPGGTADTIGPVTQTDRQGATGLQQRATSGQVPAGTRSATIVVQSTRFNGEYNDGYADDIVLEVGPAS
ncbi:MAG TPA: phosphoesterase [Candidatus Dormibacteraeota bacterium]|nr:phosphoesterase [Candidatus Dormibacteraeota bacterium]